MLAYVSNSKRGAIDTLLNLTAQHLENKGMRLYGAVQINTERDRHDICDMDLLVLHSGARIRISQDLGEGASGCRLDPDGMSRAIVSVENALENRATAKVLPVLIINKFGKQEIEGGGFRNAIALALDRNIPVVVGVGRSHLAEFKAFSGGLAHRVDASIGAIDAWVTSVHPDIAPT